MKLYKELFDYSNDSENLDVGISTFVERLKFVHKYVERQKYVETDYDVPSFSKTCLTKDDDDYVTMDLVTKNQQMPKSEKKLQFNPIVETFEEPPPFQQSSSAKVDKKICNKEAFHVLSHFFTTKKHK